MTNNTTKIIPKIAPITLNIPLRKSFSKNFNQPVTVTVTNFGIVSQQSAESFHFIVWPGAPEAFRPQ